MNVPSQYTLDMSRRGNIAFQLLLRNTGADNKAEVFWTAIKLLDYVVQHIINGQKLIYRSPNGETGEIAIEMNGDNVNIRIAIPMQNTLPAGKPKRYALEFDKQQRELIGILGDKLKAKNPAVIIGQALNIYDLLVCKIKANAELYFEAEDYSRTELVADISNGIVTIKM